MTATQEATAARPKYNVFQNFCFLHANAWRSCKSVIFLSVALACAGAAQIILGMLIAPAVLEKIETGAPLPELFGTIARFTAALALAMGLKQYLNNNTVFGRNDADQSLRYLHQCKAAETAYPNTLDVRFLRMDAKADKATSSNHAPAQHFWELWTEIMQDLIGFGVYLALLSDLDPLLLAVVIATCALGFCLDRRINEWGYRHKEEQAEYFNKMRYFEAVSTGREYAKDLRIFGLKEWVDDVWDATLGLYTAFLEKREKTYLWTNIIDLALAFARNGIAYAYLLHLTLAGGLSASQFLLYFSAVSGFSTWVTGILEQFTTMVKESADISALREFLEWPEPFQFEGGKPLEKKAGHAYELRLEHVSYRYPEAQADTIHEMDLTIRPGEKLAIVGLNGAGKSTLVKLLCGFLDPTEGRVLLDGEDIRQYNRWDYYALFSAVFQEFSVLEDSVAANVAQNEETETARVWACLDEAGLTEKIRSLPAGLETKVGRNVYEDGVEFSGGQTQRLMLARALYRGGAVLVLDEPTAALDPIAENEIYQKYSEMTQGKTSVFISHRLASTRFCDRILFLEHGKIAEQGTHEQLLALGGKYAALFEVQSRYYKEGTHDGE